MVCHLRRFALRCGQGHTASKPGLFCGSGHLGPQLQAVRLTALATSMFGEMAATVYAKTACTRALSAEKDLSNSDSTPSAKPTIVWIRAHAPGTCSDPNELCCMGKVLDRDTRHALADMARWCGKIAKYKTRVQRQVSLWAKVRHDSPTPQESVTR